MTFQLHRPNFLNTTTQIVVDAVNTLTVENSFDPSRKTFWETVGYSSNTSTIFSIEFNTSTVVNTLMLLNHNLAQFRIFYNSVTSNTFSPDANVTSNSSLSHYFSVTDQTVSTIQIQVDQAQTADTEKRIGRIYVGTHLLSFERNPTSVDYKRQLNRKQIVHTMPNGGVNIYNIDQKFDVRMKWKYITESFRDSLFDIWDTGTTFEFTPLPTTTSWDGDSFEVAWIGNFDFKHTANNFDAGFSGSINLKEIA